MPISTDHKNAIFQPIDITIEFDNNCWALDEKTHSIRICSWTNNEWHELESQVYRLNYSEGEFVNSCRVVFLIPDFADGNERYFIYYDDMEKPPITGISVEGDYYEIIEDGYIVYGIGQKGQVMNRELSQIIIKMKPKTEDFDIISSELLTSFSLVRKFSFEVTGGIEVQGINS